MKNSFLFICLATLATLFLFSCDRATKSSSEIDNKVDLSLEDRVEFLNSNNPMSEYGILHNVITDGIMLEETNLRGTGSKDNRYEMIRKSSYDKVKHLSKHRNGVRSASIDIPEDEYNEFYDGVVSQLYGLSAEEIVFSNLKHFDYLTPSQKELVLELETIFSDNDEDIDSVINRICAVEEKASTLLDGDEKNLILCSTSIAINTAYYWYKRVSENGLRSPFSWKSLGKSDLAGAVDGAVSGVVIGAIGGPVGWGAFFAGIAGAAAGSSAGNAVEQLL